MECGQPFMERNNNQIFRIGTNNMNQTAHVDADGFVHGVCGNCEQKYTVTIAFDVSSKREGIPLYMQPQTIYLVSAPEKKMRDTYCLECGKAYFSISDRIKSMVDNATPFNLLDPNKLGPSEARCRFQHCKQRYRIMT
jgi:hypothetical protein